MSFQITREQARNIQLAALGLLNLSAKVTTKEDVLSAIQKMSVLQIDTISVVNRSPYLVLFSRIGAFDIVWLEELLNERKLFEYWSHEACFLPIVDYPYYRTLIKSNAGRKNWIHANKKDAKYVLDYITKNGAVMSSTFTKINFEKQKLNEIKKAGLPAEAPSGGWWNWKTEKIALDMLYTQGDLTIVGRKNFHRIYDLTERGIPSLYLNDKIKLPDVYLEFIERTIKHLGITKRSWVSDYLRLSKVESAKAFEKLIRQKKLVEISVEGFDEHLFVHIDNEKLIEQSLNNELIPTLTTFLSPFDPLIWDRKRVKELFNFDYRIECYTPSHKRIYGYFTLPILYKGELIGRMDAKAHRKEKVFEVKAMHFEKEFIPDKECFIDIKRSLKEFANWHQTPQLIIKQNFLSQGDETKS